MHYCLCLLLLLLPFNVFAQEVDDVAESKDPIMIIYPNDNENYLNTDNMPGCNDAKLVSEVKEVVSQYLSKVPEVSIFENRKRNLVMKNINTYKEIAVSEFNKSDNYQVADELIMTKINQNMTDNNFRICVGTGKKPVYLLIYPEDFSYRVKIINFIPPKANGNDFSILYTPEVKHYEPLDDKEWQN